MTQKNDVEMVVTDPASIDDSASTFDTISVSDSDVRVAKLNDDRSDVESLEVTSNNSSVGESRGGSTEWCLVVNGTRYIGNVRLEKNIDSNQEAEEDDVAAAAQESTKERNRRLLRQHRESQQLLMNSRGSRFRGRKTQGSGRSGKLKSLVEHSKCAEELPVVK